MKIATRAKTLAICISVIVQPVFVCHEISDSGRNSVVNILRGTIMLLAIICQCPCERAKSAHHICSMHIAFFKFAFPVMAWIKCRLIHMEQLLHFFCFFMKIITLCIFCDNAIIESFHIFFCFIIICRVTERNKLIFSSTGVYNN